MRGAALRWISLAIRVTDSDAKKERDEAGYQAEDMCGLKGVRASSRAGQDNIRGGRWRDGGGQGEQALFAIR